MANYVSNTGLGLCKSSNVEDKTMAVKSANGLWRLVMLALLLAVPSSAVWAENTSITTCGTVISASGDYTLANDLLNCPGDGIDITADSVTLNLAGHQITGSGTGTGIRVDRMQRGPILGVTINGPGMIMNFDGGVVFSHSNTGEVSRVTCMGNNTGFTILSGKEFGSLHNRIDYSTASMNRAAGFVIGGEAGTIAHNTSNQNGNGFVLPDDDTTLNTLDSNTANQNANDGIEAQSGAIGNTITHSFAHSNSTYDLADDNFTCENRWDSNHFGKANRSCIH